MDYLEKRAGQIKGVVVTGGEPTLQPDLIYFITGIKELGLKVKLDTNGTNPQTVRKLLDRKLLDYAAMDIKAPLSRYSDITGTDTDINKIKESIVLFMEDRIPYEFRTTFAPTLTQEDILEIADDIKGTKAYFLQQYRPYVNSNGHSAVSAAPKPHTRQYVADTAQRVKEKLGTCGVRGT